MKRTTARRAIPIKTFLTILFLVGNTPSAWADNSVEQDKEMGWEHSDFHGLTIEYSAAPIVGLGLGNTTNALYGGVTLALGARYVLWASNITTEESYLREPMVGDHFGADVRLYSLLAPQGSLGMVGLNPVLSNILGSSTGSGRTQLSSLAEIFLPEIGYALQFTNAELSPFLGWHFAARYLWNNALSLDGRAGVNILYQKQPEAIVTVSIGASFR